MIRAVVLSVLLALTLSPLTAQQPNTEAVYQEARRLFDALDYERAVVALDQAITAFQAATADATRNERLAGAYEMRARSKFGLGDQDGAKADFTSLLKLAPAHALSGQVSPRVVALFEETAREFVTSLTISLTPATAKLQMDGLPLAGPGTVRVAIGDHVLTAEQPGYRPATQNVTVSASAVAEVALVLERVSSVVRISTAPADVQVRLDGKALGKTTTDKDAAAGAGALVVSDVESGTHKIELSRECFVAVTQPLDVARPDDYIVGPVALQPAVATLTITANQSGAHVFIDGKERGIAPVKVPDVCEGEHVIELRGAFGSDSRRVAVRAGNDVSVESVLKPSYAIVSFSGAPGAGQQDVRVIVERAFATSRTLALVAPAAADAEKALEAHQLTPDWLAVDASGRPVGAAAQIAGTVRKEVSRKLADAFRTQGVASVTMLDTSRAVIALLNAGSATPDVIEVTLDNMQSIGAAVARLDRSLSFVGASIGLQTIDVADLGVVVVGVDPSAGVSTLRPGDVIVQADGKPVADVAALAALVDARRSGESLMLDLRDGAGIAKRAELKIVPAARVIGLAEQGLLVNRLVLSLRPQLIEVTDPFEQSVIRLNMAVALARLADWAAAREELQKVKLPEQSGVGNGTVQYLMALAAENLGNRAEAEAGFKLAAASECLLSENGPPVKELAEARLIELQKTAR